MSYQRIQKWAIATLMVIACTLTTTIASAQATTSATTPVTTATDSTLFILDASGSMWGRIDGQSKIAIAKQVMAKLVPELPTDARIGLIAYGHRRKGDCNDVETLVTLGQDHQQAVLAAVRGLDAKGRTPLAHSVNQAIELLRGQPDSATVILVSDGIESCGGDPCAAVKAARASGVSFVMHTVGFGLSEQQSAQLRCMASAGGGEYFQAGNADELLASTREAIQASARGRLKLTLRTNGKPVDAWVMIRPTGSDAPLVLSSDAGVAAATLFDLPPGNYQLQVKPAGLRGSEPMTVDDIDISAGETVDKVLDFNQATLRVTATDNGRPVVAQIGVATADDGHSVFDTATWSTLTMRGVDTPYDVQLPPGEYQLTVSIPETAVAPYSEAIDLSTAGTRVDKMVQFYSGALRLTVSVDETPIKAGIRISTAGHDDSVFETLPYIGTVTPFTVTLAAGRYDLHIYPMGVDGLEHRLVANVEVLPDVVNDRQVAFTTPAAAVDNRAGSDGMEHNTDRPGGGDFRHLTPASPDPALCRDACRDDPQCRAWTYVKPGTIQGPQPNCWLKTELPAAVANDCCVSGLKVP